MQAILRKEGINVNKKKVQRIMQKLDIQVTSYTRRVDIIIPIKEKSGKLHQTEYVDDFTVPSHIKRLLLILQSLSITSLMKKDA